ncbi:MAG: hypothetical protein ACT4PL_04365, partial [Phycisphaerales bacterium]
MTHRSPRALLLIAGTLALAGCERPDPVASDLRKAADALDALHVSVVGVATVNDEVSAKRHEQTLAAVLGDASKHVNASLSGQAASAQLLQARASAGLGELGAERVNAFESVALDAVHAARGGLDIWLTQTTRAAALETYTPAKEFKEIDEQLATVDESIANATEAKARASARIADLEKRSQGLLAQAKVERTKAGELTVRAAKVSATEGLSLVEDAAKITRAADSLERQASDLAADADA